MDFLKILLFFGFISLSITPLFSQCPVGDLDIRTQSELYAFGRLYPNCTEINGNFNLGGNTSRYSDIYDISPLAQINKINGNLIVFGSNILKDLNDLNLIEVKGSITLTNLTALQDIDFISSLDTIFELQLSRLPKLESIDGLKDFESIHGNITFVDLPSLNTPLLWKLKDIRGGILLYGCPLLENLTFLSNLESIETLSLFFNEGLIDIEGIGFIQSEVQNITITRNINLTSCSTSVLCTVFENTTDVNISQNGPDCQSSLQVLANCNTQNLMCHQDEIILSSQDDIQLFSELYGNCSTIDGDLSIAQDGDNSINDLRPLSFIKEVNGALSVIGTDLVNLSGLDSISYIDGSLYIRGNDEIEDISSLIMLEGLGSISIIDNNSIRNFNGFPFSNQELSSVNITNNESLNSLSGLNQIDTIRSSLILSNNISLTNISAIFNTDHISNLFISGMDNLSNVSAGAISGNHTIGLMRINACQNLTDINLSSSIIIQDDIEIYDNPALNAIRLLGSDGKMNNIRIRSNENLKELELSDSLLEIENQVYLFRLNDLGNFSFKNIAKIATIWFDQIENVSSLGNESNLDSVSYIRLTSMPLLENIAAFDRNMGLDSLKIINNSKLSDCQIEAICNVADLSKIDLGGNGENCNSLSTVYSFCGNTLKNPVGDVVLNNSLDLQILMQEYPLADSIIGQLRIQDYDSLTHADLSYFSQIEYIQGGLYVINTDLDSLDYFKDIELNRIELSGVPNIRHIPVWSAIDTMEYLRLDRLESLTSISGFANLTQVNDQFILNRLGGLTSLDGLQNLETVDNLQLMSLGVLDTDELSGLYSCHNLRVTSCNSLNSLEGLSNLDEIYSITLWDNSNLSEMIGPLSQDSINYVWINDCHSLDTIHTFDNVKQIAQLFRIDRNDGIKSISLPELERLGIDRNIGLIISRNESLTQLNFPKLQESGAFEISSNPLLGNQLDFGSLLFSNDFQISNNPLLNDISTFPNDLVINDRIDIYDNPSLAICDRGFICNHLFNGREADFYNNAIGCETEAQIETACGFIAESCPSVGYNMRDNRAVELYNLHYSDCRALPGDLIMSGNFGINPQVALLEFISEDLVINTATIPSINFANLETVGLDLRIENTIDLVDLNFESLERLNWTFRTASISISNNSDMITTPMFESLGSISEYEIIINDNEELTTVNGFEALTDIELVNIENNEKLTSIDGFSNIQSMEVFNISTNPSLKSLPVFDKEMAVDELIITDNPLLSNCSISGICIHLDNDRTATIENNDNGCNSKEEILSNCLVNVDDILDEDHFTVYPNPTDSRIQIINKQEIFVKQ